MSKSMKLSIMLVAGIAILLSVLVAGLSLFRYSRETATSLGLLAFGVGILTAGIILPLVSKFERPLPLPSSISESVLHGEKQEAAPIGQTKPAN